MNEAEAIFPEDLDAAEEAFNVKVEPGDLLLIRTGNWERRTPSALATPPMPAPPAFTPPASLGSSHATSPCSAATSPRTSFPSGYPEFSLPVHQVILTSMGCWILDNCNFTEVARICKEENRSVHGRR